MTDWVIKSHPHLTKDLDLLGVKELEIFYKKKEKIKENPLRQKHLRGGENCYREPITENIRLVYYIEDDVIWLLTVGPHEKAYERYLQRLQSLKQKYLIN